MNLFTLFEDDLPTGYHDEKHDNTTLKLSDLRKTRLSLDQLNRMRIMNDVRKLEHEQKLKKVSKQYRAAGGDAAAGGAAPLPRIRRVAEEPGGQGVDGEELPRAGRQHAGGAFGAVELGENLCKRHRICGLRRPRRAQCLAQLQ